MDSLTLARSDTGRAPNILRWALRVCVVVLAYYLTGRLGLALPYIGSHISLIWPPAGIALAALLRWGPGMAPGVALGAACVALQVGSPPGLSLAIAAGNTLGPLAAAFALQRLGFHCALDRRRDVLLYVLAAGAGLALTATCGVMALAASDVLPWEGAPRAWLFWWLGDIVGALTAGVPLLTFDGPALRRSMRPGRTLATLCLSAATVACGAAALLAPAGQAGMGLSPLVFMPHLLLCWLALRAGVCAASFTALAVTACAAWGTSRGLGPFYTGDIHQSLALVWGYVTTLSVITVLVTALVSELAASEERWQLALDGSNTGVGDWDMRSGRMFFSRRLKALLGYQPEEITDTYGEWTSRLHPEDRPRLNDALQRHANGLAPAVRTEYRMRCKDGSWKWFEVQGHVVERDEHGAPLRFVGAASDVSERHAAEERWRLAASLFEHLHEGLLITDAEHRILHVNPAYLRMSGYGRGELIGTVPALLQPPSAEQAAVRAPMWASLKTQGAWRGETIDRRKSGETYPQQVTISAVRAGDGQINHHVLVVSDITQARRHRAQLEQQARFDVLTQLPNRGYLAQLLREALAQADREGHLLAVCYLDLDHFKPINDQLGHQAGDRLLRELASRLQAAVRGGDTVARLGGDEFVLLLRARSAEEARMALDRVLEIVSRPYLLGRAAPRHLTASIGATVYPTDRADADTLLRHADHAMYIAKQAGRGRVQFFDPESAREATAQREAVERIEAALAADELVLHYQPKVDMKRGQVLGVEALLRWRHPQQGLLPPGDFLPLIEPAEFAVKLGDWVLRQAIDQLAAWQRQGLDLSVSVNITGRHLQDPHFAQRLGELLGRRPPALARRLTLEVLETTALADVAFTCGVMEQCRSLGVRFALDDFGTGYSPLTYLKRLPVDVLKIDRSFIHNMLGDAEDLAIVQGVIGLSRTFGCSIVAEGVESAEQAQRLVEIGCEVGQGYGIAAPMPAEAVPAWIESYRQQRLLLPQAARS
jgi:diguanylate cyclase (GGDEF)-like protein/PAS domain S-box-containing protein